MKYCIVNISEPIDTYQRGDHTDPMKAFAYKGFSSPPLSAFNGTILERRFHVISTQELEELEIHLVNEFDGTLVNVSGHDRQFEIHDISIEGEVYIAWVYREGRDGGGGNMREHLIGNLHLPIELKDALVQKLLANEYERQVHERLKAAIREAHLDDASVRRQREEALVAVGLDEQTVDERRKQRLSELDLDQETIVEKRGDLENRIRQQLPRPYQLDA